MIRRLVIALLFATAAVGCGGESPPAPVPPATTRATPSPTRSPSTSPRVTDTPSPTATPAIDDDVILPRRAPSSFADDVPADELRLDALAPRGATIVASWASGAETGVEAIAFGWTRGDDPLAAEIGFEVWVREPARDPAWRAMYAFTDRPSSGVLGVRFDEGDLTGDGVPDLLTFENLGGSGACGIWRVVEIAADDASQTFSRQTCDADVRVVAGDLEIRAAVYAAGDAHCCPSAYRTTRLRWNGEAWKVVDRATHPA